MMNKKERGLSREYLEHVSNSTPQDRLKWLEEANEFVEKFVSPEKIKRWNKLKNKSYSI